MTMFGIIVGTCGVLVIDVLGQAQNEALAEQMAQLGTNVISITPGIASLEAFLVVPAASLPSPIATSNSSNSRFPI